ncbi:hypothetical protein A2W70_05700 [Candidatus Curtissbacteria bacterium RIFCSPLOWO2_02_41_11]|uniref:Uncharacterized protein n=2 Tax=Candidatus Curtissiibacteriota TaxID=1752717 RepID=A0A1F5HP77_9BACT|nr:MAG: hypothetical protein UU56_C0002G0090 [Candidatus Curtissbacteria bacterium GW2011_GWA2_41_24]OGD89526.1 MAG: hypothetical protein A2Z54_03450 [Candidatus Curtissbacteria bacterium RIFCSPHIGHO2_02_39_8]OGE05967.1 MAG: hypothetical protein A2W70_05700 [Candidatus Curtissbacteria bacterium RIFCSPLOWO2_02_41_11]
MGIESGPQISCERALLNGAIVLEKWVIENSFGEEEDIEIEAVDHFAKCDKPVCVRGAKLVRKVFDRRGTSESDDHRLKIAVIDWQNSLRNFV